MLDEERERSEQLDKRLLELETQLKIEKASNADLKQKFSVGIEKADDNDRSLPKHLTLNHKTPSEDTYTDDYEISAVDEENITPQISMNQLDYLVISTQSI